MFPVTEASLVSGNRWGQTRSIFVFQNTAQKATGMGLLYVQIGVIIPATVLGSCTCGTYADTERRRDRHTDRRSVAYTPYMQYAVARIKVTSYIGLQNSA